MNREIKFRAWDKKYECYVNVESIDFDFHGNIDSIWVDCEEHHHDHAVLNIDEVILEQYTGLKDKNGKEIYEGDIVKGEMGIFEAKWYNEIARFCFLPYMQMKWHPNCNQGTTDYMEIVGNIHENPELLEAKK